jgi:hypothetical protein
MRRMRRGPGLVGVAARTAVVAGTAGRVSRRQQQKYAAQDQGAQQQAPQAAPADPGVDDAAAEIQQLAQLKEQGLLTEEEFAAKKKQILGI